jgi:hypothetical protein
MAKTRVSKTGTSSKSLDLTTIETVDEKGEVVANAMTEIAADVRADAGRKPQGVEISRAELVLESWDNAKVLVRTFSDGKIYVGPEHLSNKWHIGEHFAIMGFYNSIGGIRRGFYPVVEEGIQLRRSVAEARKLYEGRFGYVDFSNPELSEEWVKFFAARGITKRDDTTTWLAVNIGGPNGQIAPAFQIKPEKLQTVADRLGKTIDKLSPVAISMYQETWATYHKRNGLEALLRVFKGELCVCIAHKFEKGEEWQVKVQSKRFNALFDTLEKLAVEMDGRIQGAKDQLDADQGGFVLRQAPEVLKEKLEKVGKLVTYDGKEWEPADLAKHYVIQMVGKSEVGAPLYLRDVASVIAQWEKRVNPAEGKSLALYVRAA